MTTTLMSQALLPPRTMRHDIDVDAQFPPSE
jgi:hypothetical protein